MFLPLHTTRVTLRSFAPVDAAVFAAYRNDPEVARYQDWDLPVTEAGALRAVIVAQVQPVPRVEVRTPARLVLNRGVSAFM